MAKEAENILFYLEPEEQETIESWTKDILPLLDKYPQLKDTDLVIEGGVGTGVTMPHIIRRLFPDALYVGTDIAYSLMIGQSRMNGAIEPKVLDSVQAANAEPSLDMQGAVIYANCFDNELIRDIQRKTGRQKPLLASYHALNSLLDRKTSHYEGRKQKSDMVALADIVGPDSPYIAQLHIGAVWEVDYTF